MRFSYGLNGHFFENYYRPFPFARQCLRSLISPLGGKKKGQFLVSAAVRTKERDGAL